MLPVQNSDEYKIIIHIDDKKVVLETEGNRLKVDLLNSNGNSVACGEITTDQEHDAKNLLTVLEKSDNRLSVGYNYFGEDAMIEVVNADDNVTVNVYNNKEEAVIEVWAGYEDFEPEEDVPGM